MTVLRSRITALLLVLVGVVALGSCSKSEESGGTEAKAEVATLTIEPRAIDAKALTPQYVAYAVGEKFEFVDETTMTLNIEATSKSKTKTSTEEQKSRKHYRVEILAMNADDVTKLRVEFLEHVEKGKPTAANGKTYEVSFTERKASSIVGVDGKSVLAFEADYVRDAVEDLGRGDTLEHRLAGKPLEPGTDIELTPEEINYFAKDKKLEPKVSIKYLGTTTFEGKEYGVHGIELDAYGKDKGMSITMDLTGDVIFDPATQRGIETRLGGSIDASGNTGGAVVKGTGQFVGIKTMKKL